MVTVAQIVEQARTLSPAERIEVVKQLVDSLGEDNGERKTRSLLELRGLGKDIWEGIDAQAYIDELRDEWDTRS
jgi:hypothetical protein